MMPSSLFRRRRREHRHDEQVRQSTGAVLKEHRESLTRVRQTLSQADETLVDEIRRLDRALEAHPR
jgi:hypothetical protein